MLLHETTGLRRYDAAVLSLTHMDFALGSAVRLPGTTEQGLTVQLPPLVKTEALWSLGEESGKKTLLFWVRFYLGTIILPRQARDKDRETAQKRVPFSCRSPRPRCISDRPRLWCGNRLCCAILW